MRDKTNAAAQHEQAIQHTHLEVILCLLCAESAAASQQVNKTDGDAAIDIEDQVIFLRRCDGLDGKRVIEEFGGGELLFDIVLHEFDAEIGVIAGFDAVANSGDCIQLALISGNF